MKLLTLNTHSLHDSDNLKNCHLLCDFLARESPDIVALQEVNQESGEKTYTTVTGNIPVGEVPLKEGNFSLSMQKILLAMKQEYKFLWLGIKRGYDRFDEGLAVFSKLPVKEARSSLLTDSSDYNNFKKRMALMVENEMGVFVNCHLGREDDGEEPISKQISRLISFNNFKKDVYFLGDFNMTPGGIGYNTIISSGFYDTFCLAEKRFGEETVEGEIDGWENSVSDKRIDYIFTNKKRPVKESRVVFSGGDYPKISDHFGVMVSF